MDRNNADLSIRKQCRILNLHRSGLYYKPREESALNLELMRLIDQHYLDHPYKGAPSMYIWLTRDKDYKVSRNRIERLYYEVMGLRAISPGPHTSKRHKDHAVFPYLLRDLEITAPNQVWATDITYIPMDRGFLYLTAVIDLYSRFVVNWSLSNTMEAQWCTELIEDAILDFGKPQIINTDQGSQYTSEIFSRFVLGQEIKLSMDGKGRATDNAFIERLWRSVKYEYVYLYAIADGLDLFDGLLHYFDYYNTERRHQSLDYEIPKEVYEQLIKMSA